ncbi:MAG: transposase [Balneolaceae bacterium]|nr:transposase [Balneolaceae bacterium]
MNKYKKIYIAIDLHSKHSMIGHMNAEGQYLGQQQVPTTGVNLMNQITAIPADCKHLTIEQGNMAFWAAEQLRDYVDELIICNPRHNALISRSANKNDRLDTLRLCKLLRLGELKAVWRPKQMGVRRLFYHQIKEYQRLTKTLTIHKRQLQASLRHWGINVSDDPDRIITTRKDPGRRLTGPCWPRSWRISLPLFTKCNARRTGSLIALSRTGEQFWEIAEFQNMSGMGPVGAHTFSGYIQTPHRFRRRGQLIRFCQLAVRSRTSDGRRLRAERLDKAGHGCLKNVAHIAWKAAQKSDNEVRRFYRASLARVGDPVKARLNTQRKILITLWSLWKHKRTYRPQKFYCGDGDSAR